MPFVAKEIQINADTKIGGPHPLFLIGGPCVIESREHALAMAQAIQRVCLELDMPFIFKASFDKANRSSIASFRGPGLERGLQILQEIKEKTGVPVLSDIHETGQVEQAAGVLDILQIPAFLSRQTDLIVRCAETQKPLNIKKGQFLSPFEMENTVEKARSRGNDKIILTERGTSFGYNNLVFDVRAIPIMKRLGQPVVIDASHTVQRPGGEGTFSGGDAEFIPYIARAGVSVGADGVFLEIHDNPSQALSDSRNSINISNLRELLAGLQRLKQTIAGIEGV